MDKNFNLHIILHCPEIPGNAGSIGRTCLALNAELILIQPYGFNLDEKSVRRAGLDYWKYVSITEYASWENFIQLRSPNPSDMFFIETKAPKNIYQANFSKKTYLIFGSETKGLPNEILSQYKSQIYELPMYSTHIRSLNLSNAATAASYLAHKAQHNY